MTTTATLSTDALYPAMAAFVRARAAEFDERRALLESFAQHITERHDGERPVRLVFVCTHNSRRSHMAQLWAAAGAAANGLNVATYSGGTESTAFNPRAVAALQRAGFTIERTTDDENPVYHVRMGDTLRPLTCFSKAYMHAPNPQSDFTAIMVCDDADARCPAVPGAAGRFAIQYVDPKVADGTPEEAATYDERCAQIAREMLYAMSVARP